MHKYTFIVLLALLSLVPIGWCHAGATLPNRVETPAQRPDWWLSQPAQGGYVCSYGMGVGNTQQLSQAAARENATEDACDFVALYASQLSDTFQRETGLVDPRVQAMMEKMAKAISCAKYSDAADGHVETKIMTDKGKVRYRTWIQVLIPKSAIEQSLVNNIRNEENLDKLFQQSDTYRGILEKVRD